MILRDPQHGVLHVKRLFGRSQVLDAYGCKYSAPQLASAVIKALRADCERALGGVCNRAVVTIPAYFNQAQIDDVYQACDLAGIEVARLVAEPTAACMAAGDRFKRQETGEELCFETVAVFDLGGGTFDISIVETTWFDQDDEPARVFEILSVNGDCHLGGIDYDQAIIDYCLAQFYIKTGIALTGNATAAMRLRDAAERAKIELSTSEMATVFVPFIFANATGSYDMNVQISRSGFESLTETLTSKIMECCQQALADSRLANVDYLLMIGLATRTPLIREKAEQLFGTKAVTFVDPDTAVALGAGIQASVLQGLCRETLLLDVIAHDIGIETHGDCLSPIVGRNSTIPLERSLELRTRHHNQSRILISIWQGPRATASQNVLLSRFTFAQLTPQADSKSRFVLTVDIDIKQNLYVVVRDVASSRSATFNITEEPIFETIGPAELNRLEIEDDVDD